MVKTVSDDNGTTHFFDVNSGKALAFKPKSLTEAQAVLVYYHGTSSESGLQGYLAKKHDLRSLLASKPMLFVMPWGGPDARFPGFVTATGLTALIKEGMRLAAIPTPPSRVILAAHSGGGLDLPQAAESSFDYADRLTQVWALDCMYLGEGSRWIAWCRSNPGKTLRVRASTHAFSAKPRKEAEVIAKAAEGDLLPNANVDIVNEAHDSLPEKYVEAFSKFHSDTLGRASMIERQRLSIVQQQP